MEDKLDTGYKGYCYTHKGEDKAFRIHRKINGELIIPALKDKYIALDMANELNRAYQFGFNAGRLSVKDMLISRFAENLGKLLKL